ARLRLLREGGLLGGQGFEPAAVETVLCGTGVAADQLLDLLLRVGQSGPGGGECRDAVGWVVRLRLVEVVGGVLEWTVGDLAGGGGARAELGGQPGVPGRVVEQVGGFDRPVASAVDSGPVIDRQR